MDIQKLPDFPALAQLAHSLWGKGEMMSYLERIFGKADKIVKSPKPKDFAKMKGILVVKGHGWDNAAGHVTLWNGIICADTCHLVIDPGNGKFIPDVAALWVLP